MLDVVAFARRRNEVVTATVVPAAKQSETRGGMVCPRQFQHTRGSSVILDVDGNGVLSTTHHVPVTDPLGNLL